MYINEHNLGRYWPVQGPQVTLYVPKYFLKPWPLKNRLIIIEQERAACLMDELACSVEFISEPILDGSTPESERSVKLFKKSF